MRDDKERVATYGHAQQDAWPAVVGGAAFAAYSDWLAFIHARLQKDLVLAQRLSLCRNPADVSRACVDFWTEAAQDYQNGAMRIGQSHLTAWSAAQDRLAPGDGQQGSGKHRLSRAA